MEKKMKQGIQPAGPMIDISSYGKSGDRFDTAEYDTFAPTSGGVARYAFFDHEIGTDGRTIADTSMKIKGQFPKSNGMIATALGVAIVPNEAGDVLTAAELSVVYKVLSQSLIRVNVDGKDFLTTIPLCELLPPIALVTVDDAAGTGNHASLSHLSKLERKLAVSISFGEQVKFSVDFETGLNTMPAEMAKIKIKCYMKGLKQRGK
jgi:hypothetical protein